MSKWLFDPHRKEFDTSQKVFKTVQISDIPLPTSSISNLDCFEEVISLEKDLIKRRKVTLHEFKYVQLYMAEELLKIMNPIPNQSSYIRKLISDDVIETSNRDLQIRKKRLLHFCQNNKFEDTTENESKLDNDHHANDDQSDNSFTSDLDTTKKRQRVKKVKPVITKSKYKGVIKLIYPIEAQMNPNTVWRARIYNKTTRNTKIVGDYDNELLAAQSYDTMAKKLFGVNGITNFDTDGNEIENVQKLRNRLKNM